MRAGRNDRGGSASRSRCPGDGCAFTEFGIRHGDFAIVAVAALANAARVRVAIGGCSDRPHAVELPPLAGDALAEAMNALAWSLPFDDDRHASARYRRDLVRILGRQTVEGRDPMPKPSTHTRRRGRRACERPRPLSTISWAPCDADRWRRQSDAEAERAYPAPGSR